MNSAKIDEPVILWSNRISDGNLGRKQPTPHQGHIGYGCIRVVATNGEGLLGLARHGRIKPDRYGPAFCAGSRQRFGT